MEPAKTGGTGVLHSPEVNAQKAPDHVVASTTPTSTQTLNASLNELLINPGDHVDVQVTDGTCVEVVQAVLVDERPPLPPQPPPEE